MEQLYTSFKEFEDVLQHQGIHLSSVYALFVLLTISHLFLTFQLYLDFGFGCKMFSVSCVSSHLCSFWKRIWYGQYHLNDLNPWFLLVATSKGVIILRRIFLYWGSLMFVGISQKLKKLWLFLERSFRGICKMLPLVLSWLCKLS